MVAAPGILLRFRSAARVRSQPAKTDCRTYLLTTCISVPLTRAIQPGTFENQVPAGGGCDGESRLKRGRRREAPQHAGDAFRLDYD
jgi:hypothetical protein